MATLSSKTGLPSFTTGGGGSGGRNYVFSPSTYVPAATANDLGWFNSGGTPTTITTGLPRESDLSAIQFVSTSIGDYLRYRFKADDADISKRLQVLFAETAVFGDYKLQVFSGTDAALASPLEIITQSLYTNTSGVMNLPTGTLDILANFDLTTRQYYEVRWTALAAAKTIKISGVNIGNGQNSSSGSASSNIRPWISALLGSTSGIFSNSAVSAFYNQDGPVFNGHLRASFTGSPAVGVGHFSFELPDGLKADLNNIPTTTGVSATREIPCEVALFNAAHNAANGQISRANIRYLDDNGTNGSSRFRILFQTLAGTSDFLSPTHPAAWANGDFFTLKVQDIPISQWANAGNIAAINPIAQSPIRAGTIQAFAGATTPAGWLDCDGTAYPQNQYPQLYAQIGASWATCTNPLTGSAYAAPSAGNFRVPDLRGAFLRGAGGPNAAGVTTSLAGYQADTTAKNGLATAASTVSGSVTAQTTDLSHTHLQNYPNSVAGGTPMGGSDVTLSRTAYVNAAIPTQGASVSMNHGHTMSHSLTAPAQTLTGDVETRPDNVGLRMIIKAWDESFNLAGFALATQTASGLVSNQTSVANLVAADLTTQTNCVIEAADVIYCKWSMTNNMVTLMLQFDNIAITASAAFSFTLPATVPRPPVGTKGGMIVYDNSGTAFSVSDVNITPLGLVSFSKSGGSWTGGATNNYVRGQMSWFIL